MPPKKNKKKLLKNMYKKMLLIRKFEEKLIELSKIKGKLPGMQILCNGQEAVAVGIIETLEPADVIVTNHRNHGHLLAKGADPRYLMAEIMGKKDGTNRGKSGTLHMAVPEVNALMTSTIVGASPPLAVGSAFAQQYLSNPNITVSFFGDGAAAEGSVHEAMNLASLWKLPLVFVCENNCWAGAQGFCQHCCIDNIAKRAKAYNMPGRRVDGNDVEAVYELTRRMAAYCREGKVLF
jgi:pyruvate dehydrogenase E1 component alpha subunit